MLILGPGGQLCWYGLHAITTACVPQVAVAMHPSNSQSNPAVPILFMTGDDDIVVLPATVQAQYTRAHGVEKVFVENSDNQHTDATGAPLLPLLSWSCPGSSHARRSGFQKCPAAVLAVGMQRHGSSLTAAARRLVV